MNGLVTIEKVAEVREINMLVEASERDYFSGTLVQPGILPFNFYYGDRRTIAHGCLQCGLETEAELGYGSKQLVGLGSLTRQDFNENRAQLDIFGKLFDQYLHHEVDDNGFETYVYISAPERSKGAVLRVAYYRCIHCQSQYLMLYQNQFKEHIPPFEPDEIRIKKILWVVFDHDELLRILNKVAAPTVA